MSNSAGPKITKDGLVLDFDAANYKSYPAAQDAYVNNVSLMLSMDGANNSTTFTDSSQNALAATRFGTPVISTTQSKFGGSSAYFDGASSYLSIPTFAGLSFNIGDFTIEAWVYPTATTGNFGIYATSAGGGPVAKFVVFLDSLSPNCHFYGLTNGNNIYTKATSTVSINQWSHIAFVRSGTTWTWYINGIASGSGTNSTAITFSTEPTYFGYGGQEFFNYFSGYIDDFRITKGISRYNANFTPPAAPLSLPGVITDLTKNKNLGTFINGPVYSGGSLVFNGTSSYISLGTNSNLNFGTGDFTIDCWYKLSATTPNDQGILNDTAGTFSSGSVLFKARQNSSGGKVSLQAYDFSSVGGRILTSSTTIATNAWYNATVTRIGNSFTLYINGRSESTGTFAGSMNFNNNSGTYIGYSILDAANGYLNGNIPTIRIYKARGLTSGEVYNNFVANRGRFGV